MATIERRTLKKAPAMDVVDAFTKEQATAPDPVTPTEAPAVQSTSAEPPVARQEAPTRPARQTEPAQKSDDDTTPVRRGPGRPRSKRRMESLATKIDIELRDQVDAYLQKTGGTLVDLIDEALRDRLRKK